MAAGGEGLLNGKVALVTGGSSGLGREIAVSFARHGAEGVVVADVRATPREGGASTCEAIAAANASTDASYVRVDVTSAADLASAVDLACEMGGLDVMVNAAGVVHRGPILTADENATRELWDVNVMGTFLGTQAAARAMVERGGGSIVNLSSTGGLAPTAEYSAYAASKGAVRLMTYALGAELGRHGIRVNVIHPGVTDTAMTRSDTQMVGTAQGAQVIEATPLARHGTPADVADAAVYLASDMAAFVNATSIVVDGGRLASI